MISIILVCVHYIYIVFQKIFVRRRSAITESNEKERTKPTTNCNETDDKSTSKYVKMDPVHWICMSNIFDRIAGVIFLIITAAGTGVVFAKFE